MTPFLLVNVGFLFLEKFIFYDYARFRHVGLGAEAFVGFKERGG